MQGVGYPKMGRDRAKSLGAGTVVGSRSQVPVAIIGNVAENFRPAMGVVESEGFMTPDLIGEPLQVSARFRSAIEARILELERDAARDEQILAGLTHPDHRRRHQLLVDKQLNKAFRLREMLAQVC